MLLHPSVRGSCCHRVQRKRWFLFHSTQKIKAKQLVQHRVLIWRSASSSPFQKQCHQWSCSGARIWDRTFAWPLQYQSTGSALLCKDLPGSKACLHTYMSTCAAAPRLLANRECIKLWGSPDTLQRWQQKTKQPGGYFFWLVKKLSQAFKIVSFSFHRSFVYGGVTKCHRAVTGQVAYA